MAGALTGLAIGDAMGAPLEGQKSPEKRVTEIGFGGIHNISRGDFTDDTMQALAIAESLIKFHRYCPEDILQRLVRGYLKNPQYYGPTSTSFFKLILNGTAPDIAAEHVYRKSGGRSNGSVMRGTPIGIVYPPGEVREISLACSALTHRNPVSCECSAFFNQLISELCRRSSKDSAYSHALMKCREHEVFNRLSSPRTSALRPTLDALDATHCAVSVFMETDSPEDAVITVINLGGDADTTGALCGALSGAYYGLNAIPARWRGNLNKIEMIIDIGYRLSEIAKK